MSSVHHIVYLHGFRSSPASAKALGLADWATRRPGLHWLCPQLPPSPAAALALLRRLTADWPDQGVAVIGSSLGGYYAAALARPGWRAGFLNPAVDPARDLAAYIGEVEDKVERAYGTGAAAGAGPAAGEPLRR